MSTDRESPHTDVRQDPGIPGKRAPEQLPPEDEHEVEQVPDSDTPDVDDEGHMAPTRRDRSRETPER